MTEDANGGLNTVVVEFTCPSEQANEPDNPVDQLTRVFKDTGLRFAIDEYRISREELLVHPDWKDWRESHEGGVPPEVTTFVFLSSEQDCPTLCRLFDQWMEGKRRQANEKDSSG
jgi:hypothetical protein